MKVSFDQNESYLLNYWKNEWMINWIFFLCCISPGWLPPGYKCSSPPPLLMKIIPKVEQTVTSNFSHHSYSPTWRQQVSISVSERMKDRLSHDMDGKGEYQDQTWSKRGRELREVKFKEPSSLRLRFAHSLIISLIFLFSLPFHFVIAFFFFIYSIFSYYPLQRVITSPFSISNFLHLVLTSLLLQLRRV